MELTEFLFARIAEDEDVARKALAARVNSRTAYAQEVATRTSPLWTVTDSSAFGRLLGARGSVEARPGRVLAECEAKRWITQALARVEALPLVLPKDMQFVSAREALTSVCRFLALPYSDHPDYRAEWKI